MSNKKTKTSNNTDTPKQPIRTLIFTGEITTLEPLNITKPDEKGMSVDTKGNPVISASSIRGAIRHAGHEAIVYLLNDNGNGRNLSVDEHYLLASGVDTARVMASNSQNTKIGKTQQLREANLYLSIWGVWGVGGKFAIGSGVAKSPDDLITIAGGSRQHVFKTNEELHEYVDDDELPRLEEILLADALTAEAVSDLKAEVKEIKKSLRIAETQEEKKELKNKLETIEAQIREAKDNRVGASESIQRPLEPVEAIDKGVTLEHRMSLRNPTDDELRFALWCIAMFSIKPFIGGRKNHNFGHISAEWEVKQMDMDNITPKTIGKVGFNETDGFYADIDGIDFDVQEFSDRIKSGDVKVESLPEKA